MLRSHNTVVVACGRRWGKTVMGGVLALHRAAYGGNVAWVTPTYKNARAPWRFAVAHAHGIGRIHRSERVIEIGDGRLSVYSADNDTALRGEGFDLVVVDEAAQIREETYTDVLLPTLADRDGRMLLISTPKGRNWFWREWLRGQAGDASIASFRAPTSDNPSGAIQRAAALARDRVSDRTYRQEWLAEFVEDGGGVFRGVRSLIDHAPQAGADTPHHVIGIDWGRDYDYTAVIVLDAVGQTLVAADRWTGIPFEQQIGRIRALAERYQPAGIIAEKNAMGAPLVERLFYEHGLPIQAFTTTSQSKAALIDALALAIERRALGLRDVPWLIAELEAYEVRSTSATGLPAYGAPEGMHDDGVIALALAWRALRWYHGGDA